MDELVKLVAQKTGLPDAKAKVAVDLVVDYLKQKLPPPIAGQIDGLLSGDASAMGDIAKDLGGLLGKK